MDDSADIRGRKIQRYGAWTLDGNGEVIFLDIRDRWFKNTGGTGYNESMPTAIMVIYANGGFVIASDGKGSQGSTCEQKIFPTKNTGAMVAYGVSGAASCPPLTPTGKDLFVEIYKGAAEKLESEQVADLKEYADNFSNRVGQQLSSGLSENHEVRIDFAGYFNGVPSRAVRKILFGTGSHKRLFDITEVYPHSPPCQHL